MFAALAKQTPRTGAERSGVRDDAQDAVLGPRSLFLGETLPVRPVCRARRDRRAVCPGAAVEEELIELGFGVRSRKFTALAKGVEPSIFRPDDVVEKADGE